MQRAPVILALSFALGGVCLFAPDARARGAAKSAPKETAPDEDSKKTESASDEKGDEKKDEAATGEGETKGEAEASAKADAAPRKDAAAKDSNSPFEEPGKTYYFVGLRYRGIVVPQFIQGFFATGGTTLYVNAIGPEFGIRKDGFEFGLSPWLAFYDMSDTAFKGKNDPEEAWELINSNITMLYLTSDFLWSHPLTPELAINYGLGAGFGFVFGSLHRVQSYPGPGVTDPNKYSKCIGPGNPMVPAPSGNQYCDASNDHYGNYSEPSWANGGSKPILFPWLVAQTGLRFKPSRRIAMRLDLGFGTSGFFFGLGGDYGL